MKKDRFVVLDGWRAISIILVLLCHFFPIGPKAWQFGPAIGIYGMSIFFVLSGFLVTHLLIENQNIGNFLVRRFFRIIPLAWLYLSIVFAIYHSDLNTEVSHYLFYANYPPKPLIPNITDHFWSLCVEVHFYLGIALLIGLTKSRGLLILPILALIFSCVRVLAGQKVSVITHFRIDEVLAGCTLALIYFNLVDFGLKKILANVNVTVMMLLLLVCSNPLAGGFCYIRPYVAAIMIGATLIQSESRFSVFLSNKYFKYIAGISFAVYVWHLLIASSWLGSGPILEKYLKRPILILAVFLIAHISTFYYEKPMINLGKRMLRR